MKTIELFDKEMVIEKEYEMAVCVYEAFNLIKQTQVI